jgi:hypothetical protein
MARNFIDKHVDQLRLEDVAQRNPRQEPQERVERCVDEAGALPRASGSRMLIRCTEM